MSKTMNQACRRCVLLIASIAGVLLTSTGETRAEDRRVRIINETSHTIVGFFASNVGRRSWEEDILGTKVLPPGQAVVVNIDDGSGYCLFDFKAVFNDGEVLIRERVDVCKISVYRYTE
jgi:hypothetical protein